MSQFHWLADDDRDDGDGHVWIVDGDRTVDWGQHVQRDVAAAHAELHTMEFCPHDRPADGV